MLTSRSFLVRLILILAAFVGTQTATPVSIQAAPPVIPHAQDRPPGPALSPAEALKKMKVPEGFSVELVASEPDLINPVAMCFDERGRIWVCESVEYPRRAAGQGRDRIKIFEDTDHDGTADSMKVFAEGLNIPSAIAVGHGGVWVANAPDLLFMKDTDGDDKVDTTEVVLSGFGRYDTHELPNSFVWGPDGWLYGLNGVFNESRIKHQGKEHVFTCAVFRVHPKTHEFELFAEGTSNPWGIALDGRGSTFLSACVIDHLWHIVQSGYYHRQAGAYPPHTWKIESIVKHKHQKAAYCGINWFDSDAYPESYRGKLFMGNIHGNCVNVDAIRRDGSTYFATGEPDFLSADDAWFMPVSQKTAPDGCLYVLDWYDQYHCYQDANRDPEGIERSKGRLYRVRYKNSPRAPAFDLKQESDQQLIARLDSPNVYFRETAQRLLIERNQASANKALTTLVLDPKTSFRQRMHALWVLGSVGLNDELTVKLLGHSDSAVRAYALRVTNARKGIGEDVVSKIAAMTNDSDPDVRLQVAIAAPRVQGLDPVKTLLQVLERSGNDPLIPRVVWQNLHPHIGSKAEEFVAAWSQRKFDQPTTLAIAPRVFERMLTGQTATPATSAAFVSTLRDQSPEAAKECFGRLAAQVQSGELSGDRLTKFQMAFEPTLKPLLSSPNSHPAGLEAAILAASWKDKRGLSSVRQTFRTTGVDVSLRLRALQALISAGDDQVLADAGKALTTPIPKSPRAPSPEAAAAFPGQVLAALGKLEDPEVATVVLDAYPNLNADIKPRAVELLTQRVVWAKKLLSAIGSKKLPPEILNQTQARKLIGTKDAELVAAIGKHWGTIREGRNPELDAKIAEFRAAFRRSPGDPHKGADAFKKVCGQCHKIHGQGEEVGPDITLNGRSSFDQLLSNVFDPSLVIGAAYQARTVLTKGGRVVTGLVAEDSKERIVLKLQGGKLETIPRSEVDEEKVSDLSLMPEDVERTYLPEELLDLFAFITLDRPPTDPEARPIPGMRDTSPRDVTEPALFGSILVEVAPGFTTSAVGELGLGLVRNHRGRGKVMRTHPVNRETPCELTRTVSIPAEGNSRLELAVSHDSRGDWQLIVEANGEKLLDQVIGAETTKEGWAEIAIDLKRFAGKSVKFRVKNAANGWANEFGYWGKVEIVTE